MNKSHDEMLETERLEKELADCIFSKKPVHDPGGWYDERARQCRELGIRIDLAKHLGHSDEEITDLETKLAQTRNTGD